MVPNNQEEHYRMKKKNQKGKRGQLITLFNSPLRQNITKMIIHCLSCGKSISSNGHNCPYCFAQMTEVTLELNGIEEKVNFKERVKDLVFGLVHK